MAAVINLAFNHSIFTVCTAGEQCRARVGIVTQEYVTIWAIRLTRIVNTPVVHVTVVTLAGVDVQGDKGDLFL